MADLTDTQQRYVDAVAEHGSARKAAAALGVHHSSVSSALIRAARNGHAPAGPFRAWRSAGLCHGESDGPAWRRWQR